MKTLRSLPATGLLLVSLVVPVPTRAQPPEIDLSRQQEAIRATEADFDLTEDGIVWGFETPRGGRVRYTATFTDDTWTEHGEFSHDGETWMPFLEMRLQKVMGDGVMSDE